MGGESCLVGSNPTLSVDDSLIGDRLGRSGKGRGSSAKLDIDPLTCGGFFSGGACDGCDPSDLALFPKDKPSRDPAIVTTTTGP